jgi:transcriptional regulator with XRE-family HTH domain
MVAQRTSGCWLLERTGKSIKEISFETGIERTTVSRIKSGLRAPTEDQKLLFRSRYGIPILSWSSLSEPSRREATSEDLALAVSEIHVLAKRMLAVVEQICDATG